MCSSVYHGSLSLYFLKFYPHLYFLPVTTFWFGFLPFWILRYIIGLFI